MMDINNRPRIIENVSVEFKKIDHTGNHYTGYFNTSIDDDLEVEVKVKGSLGLVESYHGNILHFDITDAYREELELASDVRIKDSLEDTKRWWLNWLDEKYQEAKNTIENTTYPDLNHQLIIDAMSDPTTNNQVIRNNIDYTSTRVIEITIDARDRNNDPVYNRRRRADISLIKIEFNGNINLKNTDLYIVTRSERYIPSDITLFRSNTGVLNSENTQDKFKTKWQLNNITSTISIINQEGKAECTLFEAVGGCQCKPPSTRNANAESSATLSGYCDRTKKAQWSLTIKNKRNNGGVTKYNVSSFSNWTQVN